MSAPRLRIAPSPTGYFHVGTARTALYDLLFARQHGGTFLLRIEDTDRDRHVEESVEGIQRAMRWLGLDWDEGPYYQSEGCERHTEAARRLWDAGWLYCCACSREEIDARTKGSATPGYDRFCRDRRLEPGEGLALRFRVPQDGGAEEVTDLIRGNPVFAHDNIEDFVVVRADGSPLYLLANVCDDIDQGITHVVRGDEHLSNTPKQQLLWRALTDRPLPAYAHLPLLVDEQRKKLSKRRHRVAVEDFRDDGYLPEAMVNYLALLGWAPGDDRELLSLEELVAEFRLEDVQPSPAYFDTRKLDHINGEHLRRLPVATFVSRSLPWVESETVPWAPEDFDLEAFNRLAPEVQTRVVKLSEVPAMVDFLFADDDAFAKDVERPGDVDKHLLANDHARAVLEGVVAAYEDLPAWTAAGIEAVTWAVGERLELNRKRTQFPVRVAVTGKAQGPPLFESMEVLGRARTLDRLRRGLDRLVG